MKIIKYLMMNMLLLSLLLVSGCKEEEYYYKKFDLLETDNIKLVVASDLHFLSKTMTEEGSSVLKENYYGDGRIICYNEELIDAFIYQMKQEKPDVILITGDLTFDGSYQNHLELTKKFDGLVNEGIRVLIIPGNHDLNSSSSRIYLADGPEKNPYLTAKQYEEMYYNFGRGNAVSIDEDSYSYYYQVSNKLGIIMIDDNYYDINGDTSFTAIYGRVKESTFRWLEKVLKDASKKGLDIVVGSHHNLFKHSTIFVSNYQIDNHVYLGNLLQKYGVKLYLSGHMHIQHQNSDKGITEVLTSALSMTPHQYGIIDYYAKGDLMYDYYAKTVDVASYAKIMEINDEKLLNFAEYSRKFYEDSSYKKTFEQIMFDNSSLYALAEANGNLMKLLNPIYFEGTAYTVVDDIKKMDDYAIIKKYSLTNYVDSIIEGSAFDYRFVKIYREILSN